MVRRAVEVRAIYFGISAQNRFGELARRRLRVCPRQGPANACYRITLMLALSRRSAFRYIAATATLASGRAAPPEAAATVFALLGDRYHNIDHYRTALGRILVREMDLAVDFSDELKLLNAANLARYKLLVILRDGMIWPDGHTNPASNAGWHSSGAPKIVSDPPVPPTEGKAVYWITPEQGKAVRRFVENGGAALLYHNVTYISPHNDDFRDVLGAVTLGHPPIRPFKVRITNREHPITRGVRDFIVTDEQHYMVYQKDPKHLLMESVNEDGLAWKEHGAKAAAGWAYDYGKGRVCYLAPGHLIDVMWNPEYVKLQKNAVRWLLRQS